MKRVVWQQLMARDSAHVQRASCLFFCRSTGEANQVVAIFHNQTRITKQ